MLSMVKCEFENVEFAEFAVKHLCEAVKVPLEINIRQNRKKFRGSMKNNEHDNATHGEIFYLLPTAVTSYNYITGQVSRPVNKSRIAEPLLNRSVTVEINADCRYTDKIKSILSSYGGFAVD